MAEAAVGIRPARFGRGVLSAVAWAIGLAVFPWLGATEAGARNRSWRASFEISQVGRKGFGESGERALADAGFGDDIVTPFTHTAYPLTTASYAGPSWAWRVSRTFGKPAWTVSGFAAVSELGESRGRRDGGSYLDLTADEHFALGASVAAWGVLLHYGDAFRLGGGPVLHFVRTWHRDDEGPRQVEDHRRLGAVVEAGAQLPPATHFFLDLTARYHFVGRFERGPFRPDSAGTPVIPASQVELDHGVFALGLGVRF